jgi:hypothetical protein
MCHQNAGANSSRFPAAGSLILPSKSIVEVKKIGRDDYLPHRTSLSDPPGILSTIKGEEERQCRKGTGSKGPMVRQLTHGAMKEWIKRWRSEFGMVEDKVLVIVSRVPLFNISTMYVYETFQASELVFLSSKLPYKS